MTKSKKEKSKKKTDKETGPESDPTLLFRKYSKQCESIGIEVNETIKKALCQNENPNSVTQLLLGPGDSDASLPLIGDGCCRALFSAILGECSDQDAGKYQYTAFEEIRIWQTNISDQGAIAISRFLSRCNGTDFKLRYLELSDNRIGATGALSIGRSLCCGMNKTLLTLKLDYNMTLGSDGVKALSKGLEVNSTLQNLSLRFCCIDEEGGRSISAILSFKRCCLQSIDLEGNKLGGKGLENLCPGLRSNASLQKLNLANNNILPNDEEALASFGAAISEHKELTEVDLQRNVIGDSGGLALSEQIKENKKIVSFKIDISLKPEIYKALCRIPTGDKKKKGKKKSKKKK